MVLECSLPTPWPPNALALVHPLAACAPRSSPGPLTLVRAGE